MLVGGRWEEGEGGKREVGRGKETYEAGEGEFEEEEVGGTLVSADFSQRECAWPIALGFSWGAGFVCCGLK